MTKPFEERNQSETARRKLKSLAKSSNLDFDLVKMLADFVWDYDPHPMFRKESAGWVSNTENSESVKRQLQRISELLRLPIEFKLSRAEASSQLLDLHSSRSAEELWTRFLVAAKAKNNAYLSEFASFYYLRGLSESRIRSLEWTGNSLDMQTIARNLFLKLFRAGGGERHQLDYLWCDFAIQLGYQNSNALRPTPWIDRLLSSIEDLPSHSGLTDLIRCCSGLVGGDKWFKAEVLEALAYAGVLCVNRIFVDEVFLPEHKDEQPPHGLENDWTYPLSFWTANGGSVNRSAIPSIAAT